MNKIVSVLLIISVLYSSPKFILTIDDVPSYKSEYSKYFAEYLYEQNIYAVMYLTSANNNLIEKNLDQISNIISMGFELGNHTYSHESIKLNKISIGYTIQDLMKVHSIIKNTFNMDLIKFRPPEGRINNIMLNAVQIMGYKIQPWNISFNEHKWENMTDKEFIESITKVVLMLSFLEKDNIILLHPNKYTKPKLPLFIKTLEGLGTIKKLRK